MVRLLLVGYWFKTSFNVILVWLIVVVVGYCIVIVVFCMSTTTQFTTELVAYTELVAVFVASPIVHVDKLIMNLFSFNGS
jgi:hypothetical protein